MEIINNHFYLGSTHTIYNMVCYSPAMDASEYIKLHIHNTNLNSTVLYCRHANNRFYDCAGYPSYPTTHVDLMAVGVHTLPFSVSIGRL